MPAGRVTLLCCVLVAGCTGTATRLSGPAAELEDTPFFPQTAHQCGPAATATVLNAAGILTTPEALVPEIYLPARRGSLQAEIVAAVRRHGGIPYVIAPEAEALLAEVRGGRPVLVLQNLGLPAFPVWHYAVVVGLDPVNDRVVLRSGRERRLLVSTRRFLQTWALARNWALVVLLPGELPAADVPLRYLKAVAALESVGMNDNALQAYAAALDRWPSHPVATLGLANAHQALGYHEEAVRLYRELLMVDPGNVIARNNLAEALASLQCYPAAVEAIDQALASQAAGNGLRDSLKTTRCGIIERQEADAGGRCRLPR